MVCSAIKVPLLTIVPIPYISKDDVDLDQYLKENFGETKTLVRQKH